MVSLRVFGNGSVQVANITPNYQQTTTTTMPPIIDPQQMEQERILARERVKQNHLNFIREQLMQILLAGRTPPVANVTASSLNADVVQIKQVMEQNNGSPTPKMPIFDQTNIDRNDNNVRSSSSSSSSLSSSSSEVYAQRLQSFYPTCDMTILDILQNNDDEQQQKKNENEKMEMKLYFDLIIPKLPDSRTHITVMWAKLRLFVFDGPCGRRVKNDNGDYSDMMLSNCETNKLIISLYQYVPPLKRNCHANIRLVDRRIIPGFYRGHIDFNVQSVINDWQNQLPNYGLMIRVNDSVSNRISPFRFIHQMNCSDTVLPIPNLAELYGKNIMTNPNKTSDSLFTNNNNNHHRRLYYPTLDLMTMEVAKDDTQDTQIMSPSSMINNMTTNEQSID
ncbi:hypothetical protein HUG17_0768 [Dermatophagoides farinae]|nr:hypothetical protein HUG17_0768 [Dermatophagoides farinae]